MINNLHLYKSNIWKYYLISLLGGFAFFYNAIETLYYQHFLLSFAQIGWLMSGGLIATLILEIPSGSFADIYGRKVSLIVASLANLLGILFLAFGSSFSLFFLGFVFIGCGRAFNSGASSAILYDSLDKLGTSDDFLKHKGRTQSAFIAIDIVSSALAPLLFGLNVHLPYYISVIAMIAVVVLQISMFEEAREQPEGNNHLHMHLNNIKTSLKTLFHSRILLRFTGFSLLFFIANKVFSEMIHAPYFIQIKGFSLPQLSILLVIASILQTMSIYFADKIENRIARISLLSVIFLIPLTLISMRFNNNYLIMGLLMGVYYSVLSFNEVIVENYLNKHIDSKNRATVLSISSMALSVIALILLPLLGKLIDMLGLATGLLYIAIATFIIGMILLALKKKSLKTA